MTELRAALRAEWMNALEAWLTRGSEAQTIREYRVWSIEYRLVEDARTRGPEVS